MITLRRTAEWGVSPHKQSDKQPSTGVSHSSGRHAASKQSKLTAQRASHTCRPTKAIASSKWSSFNIFSSTVAGGFSSLGSGPRLIPVALPAVETEQGLCNAKPVSLSANSLSQPVSYTHLTLPTIYSV